MQGFFGLELIPNKETKATWASGCGLVITLAALPAGQTTANVTVYTKTNGKSMAIATLNAAGKVYHSKLNVVFNPGNDNVTFLAKGNAGVHLTGYVVPSVDEAESFDMDSEDDDDINGGGGDEDDGVPSAFKVPIEEATKIIKNSPLQKAQASPAQKPAAASSSAVSPKLPAASKNPVPMPEVSDEGDDEEDDEDEMTPSEIDQMMKAMDEEEEGEEGDDEDEMTPSEIDRMMKAMDEEEEGEEGDDISDDEEDEPDVEDSDEDEAPNQGGGRGFGAPRGGNFRGAGGRGGFAPRGGRGGNPSAGGRGGSRGGFRGGR